jgi:hypothetical protein
MSKIFKGQGKLKIRLRTGVNLSGATCKIKYKKPNQLKGEWEADVVDAVNGVIEYNISDSNVLNISGEWKVKAYCTFPGGGTISGQVANFRVYPEED